VSTTPTTIEVKELLDQAEGLELDEPETDAYNYLIDGVWEELWGPSDGHEALRLWCLCCALLRRALAAAKEQKS
jgi:hypothetical protein